jgi:hypothetical protein
MDTQRVNATAPWDNPRLTLACTRGQTRPRAWISTRRAKLAPKQLEVLVAADDGLDEPWPAKVWKDQEGLKLLQGEEFVRRALTSSVLRVTYQTGDGQRVTSSFTTVGGLAALARLEQLCGVVLPSGVAGSRDAFRPASAEEREQRENLLLRLFTKEGRAEREREGGLEQFRSALAGLGAAAPELSRAEEDARTDLLLERVFASRDPAGLTWYRKIRALFRCRTAQEPAQENLRSLHEAMQAHREGARDGLFASSLETIDWQAAGKNLFYGFRLELGAAGRSYVATATGLGEMAGDVWTIDERGEPKNTRDACAQFRPE